MRHGLTAGALPKGCGYVARMVSLFRSDIETAILRSHGLASIEAIGLFEAALINTAVRWERHALLCQRWLRREVATMTQSERLAYSREVATASASRDRCLERLGLSIANRDAWSAILAVPAAPQLPQAASPPLADQTPVEAVGTRQAQSSHDGEGGAP
jgi:hypothetical protein